MKRWIVGTITVLTMVAAVGRSAQALELGDPAPPLSIEEWVQGGPIDIKEGKGKKTYLVEFWAVWCPPCKISVPRLTELQKKYKDDLVIIGVTAPDRRGNSASEVRKFTKRQGDAMQYVVALDKADATTNAYMLSSNVMGIPHAFLVDRDGKIAWMGSPLDPELTDVVGKVVAGTYDVRKARVQAQVQGRMEGVFRAIQLGMPDQAWSGLTEILKLDPSNEMAFDLLMGVYVERLRDRQVFRSWVSSHIATYRQDVPVMYQLAEALCKISDLSMRTPDLALEAAGAAYEGSKKRDPEAVAVYARAHFEIGDLEEAIRLQQEAVAVAGGSDRETMQGVLDHYKLCKELQGKTN